MKSIALACIILALAGCHQSRDDNALVGIWEFVADQEIDNQGNVIREDRNVRGQLIYTEDGYMSAQLLWIGSREGIMTDSIMKDDGFPAGLGLGENKWTSEQRRTIIDTYDSYFGKYSVDWDEGFVTHVEEGDMRPHKLPFERRRKFILKNDTLLLRGVDLGLRWQVLWVRKK
jgi:hypothetical protein